MTSKYRVPAILLGVVLALSLLFSIAGPAAAVGATLGWSTTTFLETTPANDGSITTVSELTLSSNEFTVLGAMTVNTHYTVANVPDGLTVEITVNSTTTATVALTGNAAAHAAADSINNLTIAFLDAAFSGGSAAAISNSVKGNLAITFYDSVVSIAAIPGVTAPVVGAVPVATINETAQYTGTVTWAPADNPFRGEVVYTATITLTPKAGFTLTGVAADFFTVAGSTSDTNLADSGVVTAAFPATDPAVIDIAAIPGVTAPATGAVPDTAITETDQYTGTVAWAPADNPFQHETVYTATITLTAKAGFTLTGVAADFFSVADSTSDTNMADTGVVTAIFPAADYPIWNITQGLGYTTIQAAITDADPGDTIEVDEGNYPENLDINKNLTLTAPDGPAVTKLDPGINTVVDITSGYTVTIDGFDIDVDTANGILINGNLTAGTTVTIENCVIHHNTLHGIYVNGDIAGTLVVNDNIIAQNGQSGIYIDGIVTGTVTITDNVIGTINDGTWSLSGNTADGIVTGTIGTGSSVEITGNFINYNGSAGISIDVVDASHLTVLNNQITNNYYDGVLINTIDNASTVTIQGTVTDGASTQQINSNGADDSYAGISIGWVSDDSTLSIEGNEVSENTDAGIFIDGINATIASVYVTGNIIHANETYGIRVNTVEASRLVIEDNVVSLNEDEGIFINNIIEGSVVEITGTVTDGVSTQQIADNGNTGIHITRVTDDSSVAIDGNGITDNANEGIHIGTIEAAPDTVTISGNIITENWNRGIYIPTVDASRLIIEDNLVAENSCQGIYINFIKNASTVEITGTVTGAVSTQRIIWNGQDDSYAGVDINEVIGNSTFTISGNEVSANTAEGIYINQIANGTGTVNITGNLATENEGGNGGIYVASVSNTTLNITDNTVTENMTAGIYVHQAVHSDVNVEDNQVHDNVNVGIAFFTITEEVDTVVISGNTVTGHSVSGEDPGFGIFIVSLSGTSLHITYNTLEENTYGLAFFDSVNPMTGELTVTNNNFVGNVEYGVYYREAAYNVASYVIDATSNWWGSASGPTHADNAGGTGDTVSDNVLYDPWRTSAAVWPIPAPPAPPAGGPGPDPAPTPTPLVVEQQGFTENDEPIIVNEQGETQGKVTLITPDDKSMLTIDAGTQMKDGEGEVLGVITATPIDTTDAPPPPASATVALMYDFGPDGATFSPPLSVTMPLPEGADPEGATIAWWDGTEWINLPTTYDPVTNMLTAPVSHFTSFAVIVPEKEEEPAPTPTPTVTSTPTPTQPAPTPTATPTPTAISPSPTTTAVTPTATPEAPEETCGLTWWAILLIVIVGLAVLGTVRWWYLKRH